MKSAALLIFLTFLSELAFSKAICNGINGSVTIHDTQSIALSGFETPGVHNGLYFCQVLGVGPGFLSMQSQISCQHSKIEDAQIMGWMIEGMDIFGGRSATAALYLNGTKFFEAGCLRN